MAGRAARGQHPPAVGPRGGGSSPQALILCWDPASPARAFAGTLGRGPAAGGGSPWSHWRGKGQRASMKCGCSAFAFCATCEILGSTGKLALEAGRPACQGSHCWRLCSLSLYRAAKPGTSHRSSPQCPNTKVRPIGSCMAFRLFTSAKFKTDSGLSLPDVARAALGSVLPRGLCIPLHHPFPGPWCIQSGEKAVSMALPGSG